MTDIQIADASSKPRFGACWYCSQKLRNNYFVEVDVDGYSRVVHKQCAKYISRNDWEQAEHPEMYGLFTEKP